jgi:hypothetical protein
MWLLYVFMNKITQIFLVSSPVTFHFADSFVMAYFGSENLRTLPVPMSADGSTAL